ncbi:MAG: queuosine precursor transporter [Candidatus Woesearchaeota archaeon]
MQSRYLTYIGGFFVAVLLISNTVSTKIVSFGSLAFDGGTLLFPLAYIFGDILTEVYGYRQTRKIIWLGFACLFLMSVVYIAVGMLPPHDSWGYQTDYEHILGIAPRIALASLVAYFAGEFSNSYILAKIKILTKGKNLWLRTISSTLVGQGVDTILFIGIAFYGIFQLEVLFALAISNYIFKVAVEVLFTPLTYLIVGFLKKKEKMDVYDKNINFSPFRL